LNLITRRNFLEKSFMLTGIFFTGVSCNSADKEIPKCPNILLAISDDQSWPHAGVYGCKFVKTPAFDRIAAEGILFKNAFCAAPQCSPTRASLLTGRNIWQNEEAGTHGSYFPTKLKVYTEILSKNGYHVGYTGKGWAPGTLEPGGRTQNPAGEHFNVESDTALPATGISKVNYSLSFSKFLANRKKGQPFCFWYGAHEPHREYEYGSGVRTGKPIQSAAVPSFLPDDPTVRNDLLDYALEIEWFDKHLGEMITMLEDIGELENTLIVVTSDNGLPFPRAKANLYELGTHIPLAIRWGRGIKNQGRIVDDFVSHIDFAPTFLEAAGLSVVAEMSGRSIMNILRSEKSGFIDPVRDCVFTGRERHTHARPDNLGYPARAVRTKGYLYIHNFKPELWPAGDPEPFPFMDIDDSPSKKLLLDKRNVDEIKPFFDLAVVKRPAEELYHITEDPEATRNVASDPKYAVIKRELAKRLDETLKAQGDPRILGYGDIFDSYPRTNGVMRDFKGFKERTYNPYYKVKAEEAKQKLGLR
jgi:N-sulfoglucosamine sulfohydrolase